MARVVKVNLLLEAARYLRGAREAKRETQGVADALDDTAKSGDKTSKALDATAREMSDAARAAAALDRRVDELRESLRGLAVQSALGGGGADLDKQFRAQQAALRKALNARKVLGDAGEDGAEGFAARFVARLGPLMASAPLGPSGAAAGVALGAAAAPTIAATIAGAVVGGVGVGGVLGGVALAARDPQVKAAGSALGGFILGDLEARASGFVPPVLEGIADIRAGWREMGPDLDRIFKSSRFVDPLVKGAVSGGRKLVAGLADAVDKADPVIDSLSRGFDQIGEAAADALSSMADDADEGAAAIDDLTLALTSLIETSAVIVHAGANVKGWSEEIDVAVDKGRYWLEDMKHYKGWLDITADGFKAGSKEALAYREATLGTADAADFATLKTAGMTDAEIAAADASGTYRQQLGEVNNELGNTPVKVEDAIGALRDWYAALDEMTGKNLDARQAQRDLEEAIDAASAAVKENGETAINHGTALDINSAKGRANAEALDKIALEANDAYDAIMDQTGSQELANGAADRGRAQFITLAQKMGLSKTAAIKLADSLIRIKDRKVTVSANTQPALTAAEALVARINNMKARIGVGVYGSGAYGGGKDTGMGNSPGQRWGGAYEHAQTGLLRLRDAGVYSPAGAARYAFAEPATGGEAFIPRYGNRDRSLDILSTAARWYGQQIGPMSRAAAPAQPAQQYSPAQLAAAVRAGLAGMSIQMDGRAVGVVQGRQADIYSRGA